MWNVVEHNVLCLVAKEHTGVLSSTHPTRLNIQSRELGDVMKFAIVEKGLGETFK